MKRRFTILTAAFALLAILAIPMGMRAQTSASITFSEQGYSNQQEISTVEFGGVTASFDKGTNSNAPKYYTSGTAIRCYGGNTMTITANNESITAITITFGSSDGSNAITSNVGTYENGSWTGSTTSVTFTIGGTSGNRRFAGLSVTYGGDTPQPTTYTVTYDANGGSGTMTDSDSPYAAGATVTVLGNEFTRTDYEFDHWNTAADDSGTSYDEDDTFIINANTTMYAQWTENTTPSGDEQWVLTSLTDLTTEDVFVIVSTKDGASYAMSNDKGTAAAPEAVAVTIADGQITTAVADRIKWTGFSSSNAYSFTIYSNSEPEKSLYCINNNNGVRVGSGSDKTFQIKDNYIYNNGQARYIGVYNNQDWRCYTSINSNITGQTFAFYKKVTGGVVPPSIAAENVSLEYNATTGSITYTINNEPNPVGILSATTTSDWLTIGTVGETVPFTCTANEAGTTRTATVTLTYTYGDSQTVTKEVTVTQAAAPVIYTTIPALFEAATSTATDVTITFGNWVVSAVNGNQLFVTDGLNGFIVYQKDHGFEVGNVLSGTTSCKLQKYNGSAELTNLTSETEGLVVVENGSVEPAEIALAELTGVNTGALVSYGNLTCNRIDVNSNYTNYYLTDGTTEIQAYGSLYDAMSFEEGKTYNLTGIFVLNNNTKRILPRNAADIEEIYTLTIEGYGNSDGGYYLIASPVTVDLTNHAMTTGDFDLYSFNDAEDDEWRNYKAGAFTSLEPGKGYLYAHKDGGDFILNGDAYTGNGDVTLHKTDNTNADFAGWNLVGNPWGVKAYIENEYYTMGEGGFEIVAGEGNEIAPMQGIFVIADNEGDVMNFSTTAPTTSGEKVVMNVTSNRGNVIDRAIVRFGEGRQLPKFQLRENSTKISIAKDNSEYAVVRSEAEGEMPVSFKAENNGTYTFSVNTENVEMEYLHLIDNMTGADIDLIANPSYSFEAKVTDYASRFRLVFSANSSINEQNANNFAFFNGNDWTINNEGEATLQVVDMTGRVLSTETINGNATTKVNAATGVYMLRLINGNNIKTQKVVVK